MIPVPRLFLTVFLLLVSTVPASPPEVSFLVGEATLIREGRNLPVRVGTRSQDGDSLRTGPASRLELRWEDGTVVRLDERAVLAVASVGARPEPRLATGRAWANVRRVAGGDGFRIHTPTAVAAVRGTVFRIEETDSTAKVALYEGRVDVAPGGQGGTGTGPRQVTGPRAITVDQWVSLVAGQQIAFRRDGSWSISVIDSTTEATDPWITFNRARDAAQGKPPNFSKDPPDNDPWASGRPDTARGAVPPSDDPWAR